jgi:OOP family OmpA-OmpF porin
MVQIARMTAAAVAVALVGVTATGCGGGGTTGNPATLSSCLTPGEPVALAVGARSNSPMPSLGSAVTAALNDAVTAHQKVSIVRIDGSPKVVFSEASPQGSNPQITKQDDAPYVTTVNQILQGTAQPATDIRAQAPQADVLDALAEAASTVPPGGNVIVMDSGLQTTEPLNFRTGLLADDPQTIVEYLKSTGELPALKGRHVYFVSLGWTASPQPPLGIPYRNKVVQIWEQIAKAAGAACVTDDSTANTNSAAPNRPPVAIVKPPPPPAPPARCSVIDLNESNNVGFDFNSTVFRDPAGARATLKQVALVIIRNGESVKLTGSTSSEGGDHYNTVLSLRRADAVAAMLRQLGVPGNRITTVGDGSHMPGRVNDRGPNGQLLIGPAIHDREVVASLHGHGCKQA